MNNQQTCNDCQAPLPADSPEGLCSKCQLRLATTSTSSEEAMTTFIASSCPHPNTLNLNLNLNPEP